MFKQEMIAITGGPSGGKTTLIEAIRRDLGKQISIVPEAASLIYRGGFPRIRTTNGSIYSQQAIFHVQRCLEGLIAAENKEKLIVCDRGSLDGVAYWPTHEKDFFKFLGTTKSKEIKRYGWVIHLDTAGNDFYDLTNPLRTESYSEAIELNDKVKKSWEGHPRRFIIPHNQDFLSKMSFAMNVLHEILNGDSYTKIKKNHFKGHS